MAAAETFRIVLPPEFASESDVVRDALGERENVRGPHTLDAAAIRRLWQEGIDSGPGRFADLDEIKREARRRMTESPLSER